MAFDPMREQLIRLTKRLNEGDIKLIIGGGYGLILKGEYLAQKELTTRFAEFPEARSTNDIDVFLRTEIITDAAKIEKIRDALRELGFEPVAEYFQFQLSIDNENTDLKVKIDLLAPPPRTDEEKELVKINKPRIRPKGAKNIHGFLTEEAITLEENLISFSLLETTPTEVFILHPFTYLVLKLFALRDRLEDEEKDLGAYHAFDIYRVIAMITEEEWEQACLMRDKFGHAPKIQEARQIVKELFSSIDATGILRIRQHARRVNFEIKDEKILILIKDLKELFPES